MKTKRIIFSTAAFIIMLVLTIQYWLSSKPVQGIVAPSAVIEDHLKNLGVCAESYFADYQHYPENITSLRTFCKTSELQQRLLQRSVIAQSESQYQAHYAHEAEHFSIAISNATGETWEINSNTLQVSYQTTGE
ncbi:MAG: hypothetical protein JKY80_05050 [Mariprofundaceae bacterium]|nr:hypothetical protein [Mariprofundaceae bacterium]